jgi:hypothetical protein
VIGRKVWYSSQVCQILHVYSDGSRVMFLLDDGYGNLREAPATCCQLTGSEVKPVGPSWPDIPVPEPKAS